jgi:hypothetical protein
MNTVPNFDSMLRDEIKEWLDVIGWTGRMSRKNAAALLGDTRAGYTRIAGDVRNYAINKYVAMGLRANGQIVRALEYERICDLIYNRLPDDLHW